LFPFAGGVRRLEANGSDQGVEIVDDALIEAIELRSPLGFKPGICFDGGEKACRARAPKSTPAR
jgi:hypothetical protein